jgi:hypothetical protein
VWLSVSGRVKEHLALNEADDLARNCDQFDDGLFNATCP